MSDMNTTFDTIAMRVMIETITAMGSGFGINEKGETVFLNGRLVEKVGLDMGDIVEAHVIPNFEDKRQSIPWRAVKVSELNGDAKLLNDLMQEARVRTPAELDQEIMDLLADPDVPYWTTADLSEASEMDNQAVSNACFRLFNSDRISKADVYARHSQVRASFCLWARDADQFR